MKIRIKPDSRLNKAQQQIIATDFGMVRNQLVIETRASLVSYALKLLQIDHKKCEQKPESQQIVIANIEELRKWLID